MLIYSVLEVTQNYIFLYFTFFLFELINNLTCLSEYYFELNKTMSVFDRIPRSVDNYY